MMTRKTSLFLTTPAFLLYAVFVLFPILYGFYLSLTNWDGLSPIFKVIGFKNYNDLFHDTEFWNSLKVTFIFTLCFSFIENILALGLALLLEIPFQKQLKSTIRVLFFLPTILTPIIVGYIWYYIYTSGFSAIFDLFGFSGLSNIQWLGSQKWSLISVVVVSVWLHMGIAMLIYISSLNNIGEDIHQAAALDGAVRFSKVLHIYLPLMMPALLINIVLSIINGFKQFDQVFSMTNGGPGIATETMSLLIYKLAFVNGQVGRASAVAYILFILVIIIALLVIRVFRDREVEA